jgi:hypothetical protein
MAQKDLIPLNKRSKEDQFRIKQMGGIKSGEVRRKKRDLKERFKLGLEIFTELKAKNCKRDRFRDLYIFGYTPGREK